MKRLEKSASEELCSNLRGLIPVTAQEEIRATLVVCSNNLSKDYLLINKKYFLPKCSRRYS